RQHGARVALRLQLSAIAQSPATPCAPLVEPSPALLGRPYQRHLASEALPMPVGVPPSAYRPPSPAMAMAMGATAAWTNDGERPDPPSEGAAEEAPAKDRYRWLESVPEPERFVEIAGWFVVVGSTMALL